jgi:hypothetical protein
MYNKRKYTKEKRKYPSLHNFTNCKWQPHVSVIHSSHYQAVKIEKNERGGACSAYGGEERRIQDFCEET